MLDAPERQRRVELLAAAFKDFRRFCAILQIVPKTAGAGRQPFRLWGYQRRFCETRTGRDVVLKARQVGFTTFEQARDIFHFLTVPGSRVVATCQSLADGSPKRDLARNYRVMFDSLRTFGVDLKFRTESAAEWVLADRDASLRIIEAGASEAAAAKKGRAGTITRLHLTETAFYEYAVETLNALLECVPGVQYGSEIVDESTPNGAAGFFYERYRAAVEGRNGYRSHFIPWFDVPETYETPLEPGEAFEPETDRERMLVARGVTQSQLKWYRHKVADKGQDNADQEYPSDPETCFLVSGRTFFERAATKRIHAETSEPIRVEHAGALCIWAEPVEGASYVIAADPSEGTGGDPGAAVVRERRTGEHVATLHGQFPTWRFGELLAELGRLYNGALIVVERNNHGHAVLEALAHGAAPYTNVYRDADHKPGWLNTAVSRQAALEALESAHRKSEWATNDARTTGEMLVFVVGRDGKPQAATGAHDDLVIAEAIAHDVLTTRGRRSTRSHVLRGVGIDDRSAD